MNECQIKVNQELSGKLSRFGAAAAYAESAAAYADATAAYADAAAAYARTMKVKPNSLELSLQAVRVQAKITTPYNQDFQYDQIEGLPQSHGRT